MAKRTLAKQQRCLYLVKKMGKDGQPEVLGKRVGYAPAESRKEIEIEFRGETFKIFVSKGQIINPEREWKRQQRKRYV